MASGMTNVSSGNAEPTTTGMPVAFLYAVTSATSYSTGSIKKARYNSDYFTYSSGTFTCIKAFTGKVYGYGLGGRNNSGTAYTFYWKVEKGSTSIVSSSGGGNSSNSVSNVSFAVGNTINLYGYCTQGSSSYGAMVMFIEIQ